MQKEPSARAPPAIEMPPWYSASAGQARAAKRQRQREDSEGDRFVKIRRPAERRTNRERQQGFDFAGSPRRPVMGGGQHLGERKRSGRRRPAASGGQSVSMPGAHRAPQERRQCSQPRREPPPPATTVETFHLHARRHAFRARDAPIPFLPAARRRVWTYPARRNLCPDRTSGTA